VDRRPGSRSPRKVPLRQTAGRNHGRAALLRQSLLRRPNFRAERELHLTESKGPRGPSERARASPHSPATSSLARCWFAVVRRARCLASAVISICS
jgi:hypothetical protein